MITDSDWLMYEIASVAMPILSFIAVIATAVVGFSNNRKSWAGEQYHQLS